MSVFAIPKRDDQSGITLGPLVALWMEQNLVHGPGDIRGNPYRLDDEKRAILNRIYELHPKGTFTPEGKDISGRRRFKRCAISVRKGWAKTEFGAAIAAAELHPYAPVRFDGWAEGGEETGLELFPYYTEGMALARGVQDPYVPMVAYTAEQSEELAFAALSAMLSEGPLIDDFNVGIEQITVLGPSGKARGKAIALAASPDARDGARTSFQLFDETHRMNMEKLVKAHQTMLQNIPKRFAADAWTLEITTSYEPGLGSVAEGTMEYARGIRDGKIPATNFFFYHRQAGDKYKILDEKGECDPAAMRGAVIDASGPDATKWSDIDYIVQSGLDPQTDLAYWERVWLNRPVQQAMQAFPIGQIERLAAEPVNGQLWSPEAGSLCTFGFDGAQTRDTTAIVGTELATGRQFLWSIWRNPGTEKSWKVPADQVDASVAALFERFNVWRLYADPYYWDTHIADWVARYMYRGDPRVIEWATNTGKKMALSLKAYIAAMNEGVWSYDGNQIFKDHLANSRKKPIHILDEDGTNLFVIGKERPDSPLKIDAAMAGCLSWEAYRDAIASGVTIRNRSKVPVSIF